MAAGFAGAQPAVVMRVAYISFDPGGGMGHYAENLGTAMQAISSEARIVMVGSRTAVAPYRERPGFLTEELSASPTRHRVLEKYNPWHYRKLARTILRHTQAELVHVTSHSIGLAALSEELYTNGVVTICTVHDPLPHDETTTAWGRWVRRYERRVQEPRLARTLAAIHVHSEQHARVLAAALTGLSRTRVYAVQHGAGLTAAVAQGNAVPPELGALEPSLPTLLLFGRLEPYKGLGLLAEALARLDHSKRLNVIVAGAGQLDGQLAAVTGHRIVLINRFIADEEIRAVFSAADVIVLPYLEATQSGVIPLSYAFEKPVIATRVGALQDIVVDGATGLLVQPRDAAALAAAIERLAFDPLAVKQLSDGARTYLERQLSWRRIAAQHADHYQRLLDTAGLRLRGA